MYKFARTTWLAMYNIDRCSQADREAFLDRVEQRMRRLWFSPTGLPVEGGDDLDVMGLRKQVEDRRLTWS